MKLNIKLDDGATMPKRANATDAGLDIASREMVYMKPKERFLVDTGVHVEIPEGYMGLLVGRSSMGKRGLDVHIGIIDSDYRGAIKVNVTNNSRAAAYIVEGERIAQLIVVPIGLPEPLEVEALTETDRGEGGFGSTGR